MTFPVQLEVTPEMYVFTLLSLAQPVRGLTEGGRCRQSLQASQIKLNLLGTWSQLITTLHHSWPSWRLLPLKPREVEMPTFNPQKSLLESIFFRVVCACQKMSKVWWPRPKLVTLRDGQTQWMTSRNYSGWVPLRWLRFSLGSDYRTQIDSLLPVWEHCFALQRK